MTSRTLRVAVAVCCLTAVAGFAADLPESEVHVLSGATVIDGTGAAPRSKVTLVVKNGLIDSHTHFFPVAEREPMLEKALYGGVTAMRDGRRCAHLVGPRG